jgi:hypothetical protein
MTSVPSSAVQNIQIRKRSYGARESFEGEKVSGPSQMPRARQDPSLPREEADDYEVMSVDEADEGKTDGPDDGETDEAYDPETDEAYDPETDEAYDPETDEAYDPETDEAYDPETDEAHDLETDEAHDSESDSSYDPDSDSSYDPKSDEAYDFEMDKVYERNMDVAEVVNRCFNMGLEGHNLDFKRPLSLLSELTDLTGSDCENEEVKAMASMVPSDGTPELHC